MAKPKVLIIDDEADIREVTARFLSNRGIETASAADAESALLRVQKEKFDAVLLDVELPGLSGLKAIEAFSADGGPAVFLMTGHADSELEKDALLLGAKAFFPKPLDFEAVVAALAALAEAK